MEKGGKRKADEKNEEKKKQDVNKPKEKAAFDQKNLEKQLEDQERYSRRDNVIIHGIPHHTGETHRTHGIYSDQFKTPLWPVIQKLLGVNYKLTWLAGYSLS